MTEYLKKSFTVRFHTPAAKEKCAHCGTALETVIYRLNREPRCQDCFKDPRRVLSTNNNQPTSKGTDDAIHTNTDQDRKDHEKQQTAEGRAPRHARAR